MISPEQHAEQNAKYLNETRETALVQVFSEGKWSDYCRATLREARIKIKYLRDQQNWRVVDWITREEIDLTNYLIDACSTVNENGWDWKGGSVSPENAEAWKTWRAQCHAELDAFLDAIDFTEFSQFNITHGD